MAVAAASALSEPPVLYVFDCDATGAPLPAASSASAWPSCGQSDWE